LEDLLIGLRIKEESGEKNRGNAGNSIYVGVVLRHSWLFFMPLFSLRNAEEIFRDFIKLVLD